jgi:predicted phosphohydrolase
MSIEIQYVSDLHDKYPDIQPKCKYLALLGDIGNPFSNSYKKFIRDMSLRFEKVFIISGNHEYYCHTIRGTDKEIEELCDSLPNCIYFNNKSIYMDKFLIVGTTLWSDIDDHTISYMNDFKYIYETPTTLLRPETYRQKFTDAVDFIKIQIEKKLPTIILTHHAPHLCMNGKYKSTPFCSGFSSPLTYLNQKHGNIKCWLSGHTHQNIDEIKDGIILSANCLGYTNEGVDSFDVNKSIVINLTDSSNKN